MKNNNSTKLTKKSSGGLHIVTLSQPDSKEFQITGVANGNNSLMLDSIDQFVSKQNARIVSQLLFAPAASASQKPGQMSLVQEKRSSAQAWAVAMPEVTEIKLRDQIVGFVFEDENARYCAVTISPDNIKASKDRQTESVLEKIQLALAVADMDFTNVVRTWFYLDDILSWYDKFNNIRNKFFDEHDLYDHILPASTGIGLSNSAGFAVASSFYAVKPKNTTLPT